MYKELIISMILVFFIVVAEVVTQNYTKKTIGKLIEQFENLEECLENKDYEEAETKVAEIDEFLNGVHDKFSYYIEHDEIETMETDFTSCKSYIKTENYDFAMKELQETKYVLEHISDKYSFSLVNIL